MLFSKIFFLIYCRNHSSVSNVGSNIFSLFCTSIVDRLSQAKVHVGLILLNVSHHAQLSGKDKNADFSRPNLLTQFF